MALRDFFRQRAGVADAGGASVADDMEFQFLEIRTSGRRFRDSRGRLSIRARAKSSPTAEPTSLFRRLSSPAILRRSCTEGFEVLVQEVMAAITTLPCLQRILHAHAERARARWDLRRRWQRGCRLPAPSVAELPLAAESRLRSFCAGFRLDQRRQSFVETILPPAKAPRGPADASVRRDLARRVARSSVSSSEYSASGVLSS